MLLRVVVKNVNCLRQAWCEHATTKTQDPRNESAHATIKTREMSTLRSLWLQERDENQVFASAHVCEYTSVLNLRPMKSRKIHVFAIIV